MLRKLIALAGLAATPAFAEPVEQTKFATFVKSYHDNYLATTNAIVKSEMVMKRDADLDFAVDGKLFFKKWEMVVVAVNIDERSGKPWLLLASDPTPAPTYVFMNQPRDQWDLAGRALAPYQLEVARTLELGDRVIVTGLFTPDGQRKFADYDSYAGQEQPSMLLPKFAVRFVSIEKVGAIKPVRQPTLPDQAPSVPPLPSR